MVLPFKVKKDEKVMIKVNYKPNVEAVEMVSCLIEQDEDLSRVPQHPYKTLCVTMYLEPSALWRVERGELSRFTTSLDPGAMAGPFSKK